MIIFNYLLSAVGAGPGGEAASEEQGWGGGGGGVPSALRGSRELWVKKKAAFY